MSQTAQIHVTSAKGGKLNARDQILIGFDFTFDCMSVCTCNKI